jgi:hypothetical protein
MKDLIINGYAVRHHMQAGKSKRSKRRKETKVEMFESTGENQPDWLDTLKEEIANLK